MRERERERERGREREREGERDLKGHFCNEKKGTLVTLGHFGYVP